MSEKKSHELHPEKYVYNERISQEMIDDSIAFNGLTVHTDRDIAFNDVWVKLRAYVWGETLQDESVCLSVEYPRDWWQHFKQRWFPSWALRRWPIVMKRVREEHTFKTVALWTGFKYEPPPKAGRIKIFSRAELCDREEDEIKKA